MQTLSLIPECVISVSSKEEGSIDTYQDLVSLPIKSNPHQTVYLPKHGHATGTWVIDRENRDQVERDADIVLTKEKDVVIVHQFADCVPVLFVDRKNRALCFAHLGWKGLTMGGVQVSLLSLQAEFGSRSDDLWVWIGPCIQKESYLFDEVPAQNALPVWKDHLTKLPAEIESIEGQEIIHASWSIDMPGFILTECVRNGIDATRVISDGRDTYRESEIFFSHQRYLKNQQESDHGVFVVACSLL